MNKNKTVQVGTLIILSKDLTGRKLINIPASVERWKIRTSSRSYPVIFLLYHDGIERRVLCPVGDNCMEPGFILEGNKRRNGNPPFNLQDVIPDGYYYSPDDGHFRKHEGVVKWADGSIWKGDIDSKLRGVRFIPL